MTKVLVTGGAGFIGSHIVDKLVQKDYEVIVVDNFSGGKLENIPFKNISIFNCDITTKEFQEIVEKEKPQYIIHQAAQVSVPKSVENFMLDEKINIKGSLNVIEAARKFNVEKIVYASSAAVYGEPSYLPVDIAHPTNPQSPYGLSKYTVEKYLEIASNLYGIKYTALRYANVYGERQSSGEGGVITKFLSNLFNKLPLNIYGDGKQTRDFIHVDDVAEANIKALSLGNNMTLNVSTGKETSLKEIVNCLKKYDQNITVNFMPPAPGDIKESFLCNKQTKEVLNWNWNYDVSDELFSLIKYYENKSVPLEIG